MCSKLFTLSCFFVLVLFGVAGDVVFENFEGYADTSEMLALWPFFGGSGTSSATLETTVAHTGNKCIKIDSMGGYTWFTQFLSPSQNWSGYDHISMWVRGDYSATSSGADTLFFQAYIDPVGEISRTKDWGLRDENWRQLIIPIGPNLNSWEQVNRLRLGVVSSGYHLYYYVDDIELLTAGCEIVVDGYINFIDFAGFAQQWLANNCFEMQNGWCCGADIDTDGSVDFMDFAVLAQELEETAGRPLRIKHSWTSESATIYVEGLTETVRMLHITDSHIGLVDGRETPECLAAVSGRVTASDGILAAMMTEANGLDLDLVAWTGDTTQIPSYASVDFLVANVQKVTVPVLYTLGNHDWEFPSVCGGPEEGVARLEPLHHGNSSHDRHVIGGIQFLMLNDSEYQINDEQLAFVKQYLANGLPTVVLMHIPISIATLRDATLDKWEGIVPIKYLLLNDPDDEGMTKPSTAEFVRTLVASDNLVAVFCGHLHIDHVDAISPRAVQYVTNGGNIGVKRLVEFRPW